jgi:hypothetical protein
MTSVVGSLFISSYGNQLKLPRSSQIRQLAPYIQKNREQENPFLPATNQIRVCTYLFDSSTERAPVPSTLVGLE